MESNKRLHIPLRAREKSTFVRAPNRCGPLGTHQVQRTAADRPPGDIPGTPGYGGGDGERLPRRDAGTHLAIVGTWIALAPIAMMFIALLAADWALRRGATGGSPLQLPKTFTLDLAPLLAAWLALGRARATARIAGRPKPWMWAAFTAGALFLLGQAWGWRKLLEGGLGPAAAAHTSFFYVLSLAHLTLVAGGLTVLTFLLRWPARGRRGTPLEVALQAVGLFWGFLGALWLAVLGALQLFS